MVVPADFRDLLLYTYVYFCTALLLFLHVIWEVWSLMGSSENKAQNVSVYSDMLCGWRSK